MCSDDDPANLPCRYAVKSMIAAAAVALSIGSYAMATAAQPLADVQAPRSDDSVAVAPAGGPGDDGWPDLSSFMDQPYGFLPVLSPITEPAVGYGVYGGPTFISKPLDRDVQAGFGRPNITFVGGGWTENDTWFVMGEDMRQWLNDRLQTVIAGGYASINLKFYGIGENSVLLDNPISYNLKPLGLLVKAKYRIGESCFWVGLGYQWLKNETSMDVSEEFARLQDFRRDTHVGGFLPLLSYDTRDNMFTPASGSNIELSAGFFDQGLGGDASFQKYGLTAMQFLTPLQQLTFGIRGDGLLSYGEVPFYMLPAVSLRGAPQMRYQGKQVAQGELEVRWQFWKRISIVGFGGYGAAWNDFERLDNNVTVLTGGVGLRYELARRYGVHAGVDFAWAPDGFALYIQFGHAWMWQ